MHKGRFPDSSEVRTTGATPSDLRYPGLNDGGETDLLRLGLLTPTPRSNEHRSASKAPRRSTAKGSPRDRTDDAHAAFPRSAAATREAHRRPAPAARSGREGRVPAPVRARRRPSRGGRLPYRPGGLARGGLDGSRDGVPAGRGARRDLERRPRPPRRRGRLHRDPRDAGARRPRRPQRLVPHGQPAAPPPVGPQRGGLLRGRQTDLGDRDRVHPRPARRPPHVLAHRPRAEALAGAQQRDRPLRHVLLGPSPRPARVRPARLPRDRRGGRGGRCHARVQPGQRPPQPRLALPGRPAAHLDRRTPAGLLGRGRAVEPGRLRALLRHPRGGDRRLAARRLSTASPTTARRVRR